MSRGFVGGEKLQTLICERLTETKTKTKGIGMRSVIGHLSSGTRRSTSTPEKRHI